MKEYYKKIDKSFFYYGITIPKDYVDSFLYGKNISEGESREITVLWKNKSYNVRLSHVNRTTSSSVHQLRWDNNKELLSSLRKEFIQSYCAIESQNFKAKEEEKYYITKLLGGNQEVIIFKPIDEQTVELKTFIKIETPYDSMFKRLIEENVFGWLSKVEKN